MPAFATGPIGFAGAIHSHGSFLKRPGWDAFKEVVAILRERCPAAKPVVIRTSSLPAATLGECIRRRERFVVRLNKNLDEPLAVETLCHEWAHALAWNFSIDRLARDPDVDRELLEAAAHDEAWGCSYSRVWRAYLATAR